MFHWINRLDPYFPIRYSAWVLCMVASVPSPPSPGRTWGCAVAAIVFLGLVLVGMRDVLQKRHAILRNYPVIGHLRFLLEFIRPEMRQYFIESDNEAAPVSRASSARSSTSAPRATPTSDRSARR